MWKNTAITSIENLNHDEQDQEKDPSYPKESNKQEGRNPTIHHSDCRLKIHTEESEKAFLITNVDDRLNFIGRKNKNKNQRKKPMPMLLSFRFKGNKKEKTETERKGNLASKGRMKLERIPKSERKFEKEKEIRGPNTTDKATPNHIKRKTEKEKEPTKKKNIGGLSCCLSKGEKRKLSGNVRKWFGKERNNKTMYRSKRKAKGKLLPEKQENRLTLRWKGKNVFKSADDTIKNRNKNKTKTVNRFENNLCKRKRAKRNNLDIITEKPNEAEFSTCTALTNHKMKNRKGVKECGIFHL